jgi:hypothetical protein
MEVIGGSSTLCVLGVCCNAQRSKCLQSRKINGRSTAKRAWTETIDAHRQERGGPVSEPPPLFLFLKKGGPLLAQVPT